MASRKIQNKAIKMLPKGTGIQRRAYAQHAVQDPKFARVAYPATRKGLARMIKKGRGT